MSEEITPAEWEVEAQIKTVAGCWVNQTSGPFLSRSLAEKTAAAIAKTDGVTSVQVRMRPPNFVSKALYEKMKDAQPGEVIPVDKI